MDLLRDPIWQFVGVLVATVSAVVPAVIWLRRRGRDRDVQERLVIAALRDHVPASGGRYEKHKKRKSDGILIANISSDFLNQFPVPLAVMAAHLDRIYTPENFGDTTWLGVFKRLTAEGHFVPPKGVSPQRLKVDSLLDAGPQLQNHLRLTARMRRSINGLDDD